MEGVESWYFCFWDVFRLYLGAILGFVLLFIGFGHFFWNQFCKNCPMVQFVLVCQYLGLYHFGDDPNAFFLRFFGAGGPAGPSFLLLPF